MGGTSEGVSVTLIQLRVPHFSIRVFYNYGAWRVISFAKDIAFLVLELLQASIEKQAPVLDADRPQQIPSELLMWDAMSEVWTSNGPVSKTQEIQSNESL